MEAIDNVLAFLKIDKSSYELQQTLTAYSNFKEWLLHRFKPEELKQLYHPHDFEIAIEETTAVYRYFKNEIWQYIRACGSTFAKIDTLKVIAVDSWGVCDHEAFENFMVRYAIVQVAEKITESNNT